MKKRAKRLMGGMALVAGALGTALMLRRRRTMQRDASSQNNERDKSADKWARPGMSVTFRAELMPGRSRAERTFRITKLLPSGRVLLEGVSGEHAKQEFEPVH